MSLIDATYFRGELNIANLSQPAVQENLDFLIEKYERDLLDKLLGYSLAAQFIDGIKLDPVDQKWIDLKDGLVYTEDIEERRWMGLINDQKQSIIANYVYYHYIINQINHTVGIGNVKSVAENSVIVSPAAKLERAWNEMCDWIRDFRCYMRHQSSVFPTWRMSNDHCCYFRKINQFNI